MLATARCWGMIIFMRCRDCRVHGVRLVLTGCFTSSANFTVCGVTWCAKHLDAQIPPDHPSQITKAVMIKSLSLLHTHTHSKSSWHRSKNCLIFILAKSNMASRLWKASPLCPKTGLVWSTRLCCSLNFWHSTRQNHSLRGFRTGQFPWRWRGR